MEVAEEEILVRDARTVKVWRDGIEWFAGPEYRWSFAGLDGFQISADLENWVAAMGVTRQVSQGGMTDRIKLTVPSAEEKLCARIFLDMPWSPGLP
ncbi:MAG: hypothetical protein ACJAQT_001555 [Akkermansiaceae bacterium]|jgi:hypothetical protein